MASFKLLPSEIREMIYWNADLQVQLDNVAPALVLACARDALLYSEVIPIYKARNAIITLCNQQSFKKIKMKELLKIRYLKLQFPEHENMFAPLFSGR